MEKKDVELIDYIRVIWKRKWTIIIGTLSCMILAGVVSFLLKTVYEIDAIIQPGKFFVENRDGDFEQVIIEGPQQIADKVSHKSYNAFIAGELKIDEEEMPELKAENLRNTLLIRLWIRDHDVDLSKEILDSMILFIKKDADKKIDVEFRNIDSEIKGYEIEKERRIKEIEILKKKLSVIEQREKDISKEMESVKNKISELEKEQLKVLKKEDRSEIESLGLLLYSNEIQQSLRYYDILNEKLSGKKYEEGDINSALQIENAAISNIDNMIINLKEKKGRIDYTKIIKKPTSSLKPVFPKKINIIAIIGIFSLMIITVFELFFEFIRKHTAGT